MLWNKIIANIGHVFLLINIILFFKYRTKTAALSWFWFYLLVCLVIQVVSKVMNYNSIPNLHLSHFYFISQLVLLGLFYRNMWGKKVQKRAIIMSILIVLVVLGVQYYMKPELYHQFNLLEVVITSLPIVAFSIVHFYKALENEVPYLYINSGVCLYLLSSTLIFSAGNFVNASDATLNILLWLINSILYIVFQGLIFMEWYKNLRHLPKKNVT